MAFTKIINYLANAVIAGAKTGATINFDSFTHAILILKVGTLTGTASVTPKIQIQLNDGSWIDYKSGTAISASNGLQFVEVSNLSAKNIRAYVAYSGSGSFAGCTIETQIKVVENYG